MKRTKMYIPKFENKNKDEELEKSKQKKQELINKYKNFQNETKITQTIEKEITENFDDLKERYKNLDKKLKQAINDNNKIKEKMHEYESKIKYLKNRNKSLNKNIDELKDQLFINKQIEKDEKVRDLEDLVIKLQKEIHLVMDENIETRHEASIFKDKTDYYQYLNFIKPYKKSMSKIQSNNDKLISCNEKLKKQNEELYNENKRLEEINLKNRDIIMKIKQDNYEYKKKNDNISKFFQTVLSMFIIFKKNIPLVLEDSIFEDSNFPEIIYGTIEYDIDLCDYVFVHAENHYVIINLAKKYLRNKVVANAFIDNQDYAHIIGDL